MSFLRPGLPCAPPCPAPGAGPRRVSWLRPQGSRGGSPRPPLGLQTPGPALGSGGVSSPLRLMLWDPPGLSLAMLD